jgi:hypothetical protein
MLLYVLGAPEVALKTWPANIWLLYDRLFWRALGIKQVSKSKPLHFLAKNA